MVDAYLLLFYHTFRPVLEVLGDVAFTDIAVIFQISVLVLFEWKIETFTEPFTFIIGHRQFLLIFHFRI